MPLQGRAKKQNKTKETKMRHVAVHILKTIVRANNHSVLLNNFKSLMKDNVILTL